MLEEAGQIHEYFALKIEKLEEDWAERSQRSRKYVPLEEAIAIIESQSRRKDKLAQLAALKAFKDKSTTGTFDQVIE